MLTITTITTKQPQENSNGESDFNIKKQRVQTDNLTMAMWHHDTSRELDPHLHCHCVVMNFTQLDNGRI